MANMLILAPLPVSSAAITVSRGTGAANLVRRSPRAVWQDSVNDGSPATIDIDLGAATAWDTVALIGTNAAATATWAITAGAAGYTTDVAQAETTLRAPSDAPAAFAPIVWPALHTRAQGIPDNDQRFVRLTLTQPAGAGALQVGGVLIGKAFKPVWNREWDGGRGLIDTGQALRLPDGGIASSDGVAVPTFNWVFGDLSDAELAFLWALVKDRRSTRPALVVEDPADSAGLAERIHYGRFVNIDKYSRRQASKSRWAFEFEDWL